MIQDFQTLSSLYYTAAHVGLRLGIDATQVADSFAQMSINLQEQRETTSYFDSMQKAYQGLSLSAQKIYKVWVETEFLRNAELGLGCCLNLRYSIREINSISEKEAGVVGFNNIFWTRCEFDAGNRNYVAFSSFIKVLPIIVPDREGIYAFNQYGFLGWVPSDFIFWSNEVTIIEECFHPHLQEKYRKKGKEYTFFASFFKVNKEEKCLVATQAYDTIKLYPIPFTAAKGVSWEGGAAGSASLASFEDLQQGIKNLKEELAHLKAWSFSSDTFEGVKWKTEMGLSDIKAKEHYLGIVPKQADLMKLFSR
jgi:hypothetical protein